MPDLADAIRIHREDLHREILGRIESISDPRVPTDPDYAAGTRGAVFAALDYATALLENDESQPPPVPEAVLLHARLAARSGVALATVLRRYMAGFSLLSEVALREVKMADADRNRLLLVLSMHLDFLLARIGEDYSVELESRRRSIPTRRAEAIQLLLAGMPAARSEIAHDWDAWHVGLVGVGSNVKEDLRLCFANAPGRLLLEEVESQAWAWVSSREQLQPSDLVEPLLTSAPEQLVLGVGEPARGLDGWRRSHRQATAALRVARLSSPPIALYSEAGVVAAILHDDLLIASLRDRYLLPVESDGRGADLRRTLRRYLSTECNVSSTAAALGVSRRTVRNRLRRVEERAGLRIGDCLAELDLAMRIAELQSA
jgi:hypothetical protein